MKRIHELTQEEYEALPPREYAAVTRLLLDIEDGRVHAATSDNDLTPAQLADQREEFARRALVAAHPRIPFPVKS